MRCRDALLSREHMEKVREGETGNRSRNWPGPPGTGREIGLGHVRSDLARHDVCRVWNDVVLLNIQTPPTINRQHLTSDIGRIEAKIGHRRSNIFRLASTTHYRFVQDFLLVL